MKNDKSIKEKKYIKKYNLIDFIRYDSLFDMDIRIKGDKVYKSNSISNYSFKNNIAYCKLKGTEIYDVSIEFDKKDNIIKTNCTCPYFKKGNNCKHLYALLIKSKLESNYDKLINIQNKVFYQYSNLLNSMIEYFNNNIQCYTKSGIEKINNFISHYRDERIPRFKKILSYDLNQIGYLSTIIEIQEEKKTMFNKYREFIVEENEQNYQNFSYEPITHKKRKKFGVGKILYGIVSGFIKGATSDKESKKQMDYAIKELENGNPEPYVNLTDYIDDDIIDKMYPIEQEDEDDYD